MARRTLFENAADIRFFLSRLARAVRRGDIEFHAYSILTTHFHLLVRSLRGRLSLVMKASQNEHVRRFNRGHKRDGPLVRGRFTSKPVRTEAYRAALMHYIDHNPVGAGLVDHPCEYPHGSAWHFARPESPPWLARAWVEEHVRSILDLPRFEPAAYLKYAENPQAEESAHWIDARMAARTPSFADHDPLDDLLVAAPPRVLAWMRRKALLADGTEVDLPLVSPATSVAAVVEQRRAFGDWEFRRGRSKMDGWRIAEVALLRDLSSCTFAEIGRRIGVSTPHSARLYQRHRSLLEEAGYAERIASWK